MGAAPPARLLAAPAGDQIKQGCLVAGTQAQGVDFTEQLPHGAETAQVGVDARGRSGIHQVALLRVDAGERLEQIGVVLEYIFLVVVLGQGKRTQGQDLGADRAAALFSQGHAGCQRRFLLLLVVKKDRMPILERPDISRGGIVAVPENGQQVAVGNATGVVIDLNRLGVITDILISGTDRPPAGVADAGPDDPLDGPEPGLDAPESPQAEGGGFDNRRHRFVDERYVR
jgi:hypothetical protein